MRLRCGVATAALIAAAGFAAPARAQYVDWRASVTLTGAYTETVSASPSLAAAGPTISLSPALIGLFDTPRTENTLTYGLSLSEGFTGPRGAPASEFTYANRLAYTGHYALDEITSMTFGVGLTEAPLYAQVPSQDATSATIQAVPPGLSYLLSVSANEGFSRQLEERTSFSQGGSFAFGDPIDPTTTPSRTFSASNNLGLNRTFAYDNVGITLTNQLNYFTASEGAVSSSGPAAVTPPGSAYLNTLALTWARPFSERLSGTVVAGVTQTLTPGATTLMAVQPSGGVTLNYNFNIAAATLAYTHSAQPNLATASVNYNDAASLRFSVPIGVTGLIASGSGGYTHSVPIVSAATPVAGAIVGPSNVVVADASLAYNPRPVPTLTLGLRGNVMWQMVPSSVENTFTSYTIGLNVTFSYPNAAAAALARPQLSPLVSTQPPSASEIISTERFFSAPVSGPPPAEAPPVPAGP